MTRPFTLFTGQWADLTLEEVAKLAAGWGYDGLEIAVSGEHLDAWRWDDDAYVAERLGILEKHGLKVWPVRWLEIAQSFRPCFSRMPSRSAT